MFDVFDINKNHSSINHSMPNTMLFLVFEKEISQPLFSSKPKWEKLWFLETEVCIAEVLDHYGFEKTVSPN